MPDLALVPRKPTLARRQTECFLHCVDDSVYNCRSRIGPEIQRLRVVTLSCDGKARVFLVHIDGDIRICFVVLQLDVISRLVQFYQAVFKRQRFHFRIAHDIFKIADKGGHYIRFDAFEIRFVKVLRNAVFQLFGLAHIDDFSAVAAHNVYPRRERKQGSLFAQTFRICGIYHIQDLLSRKKRQLQSTCRGCFPDFSVRENC